MAPAMERDKRLSPGKRGISGWGFPECTMYMYTLLVKKGIALDFQFIKKDNFTYFALFSTILLLYESRANNLI
jgi:hypothetical protein